MKPGQVVSVSDFEGRLTEGEAQALHYLTSHYRRLALPTMELPRPDGDQGELLTGREREALSGFYEREAGL